MKYGLGKSAQKLSAGDARAMLEKRYPKATKKDIEATIDTYYGEDEGTLKLNADKDGDVKATKQSSKDSAK